MSHFSSCGISLLSCISSLSSSGCDWGTSQALSSGLSPNEGIAVMNAATKCLSGKALLYTGMNIS